MKETRPSEKTDKRDRNTAPQKQISDRSDKGDNVPAWMVQSEKRHELVVNRLAWIHKRAREGTYPLENQFQIFLDKVERNSQRSKDDRTRHIFVLPEGEIGVRHVIRELGNDITEVIFPDGERSIIKSDADTLEITDIDLPEGEAIEPFERFYRMASTHFPGTVICLENLQDPELIEWCREQGWSSAESSSRDIRTDKPARDWYIQLPPLEKPETALELYKHRVIPGKVIHSKKTGN